MARRGTMLTRLGLAAWLIVGAGCSVIDAIGGDGPACGHWCAPPQREELDESLSALKVVDLKQDGAPPAIVVISEQGKLGVYEWMNGKFGDSRTVTLGDSAYSMAPGDFEGDGSPIDLAVLLSSSSTIRLLRPYDDFSEIGTFTPSISPMMLHQGGFGDPPATDLVVGTSNPPRIAPALNDGAGNLTEVDVFQLQPAGDLMRLAVGSIDFDGTGDIAYITGEGVGVVFGNGLGSFGGGFFVGAEPTALGVRDYNGDGNEDIAYAEACTGCEKFSLLTVLDAFGNVLGKHVTTSPGRFEPWRIRSADFDGDSRRDVAMVNGTFDQGDTLLLVLLGAEDFGVDGAGRFTSEIRLTADWPDSPAIGLGSGDFNGDGIADFVVGLYNGQIAVFLSDADGVLEL